MSFVGSEYSSTGTTSRLLGGKPGVKASASVPEVKMRPCFNLHCSSYMSQGDASLKANSIKPEANQSESSLDLSCLVFGHGRTSADTTGEGGVLFLLVSGFSGLTCSFHPP